MVRRAMNEIVIERSTSRLASEPWHAITVDAVRRRASSGHDGLSPAKHARRLAEVGLNRLPQPASRGPLIRFLAQFHIVFIYVLLAAATLAAALVAVSVI